MEDIENQESKRQNNGTNIPLLNSVSAGSGSIESSKGQLWMVYLCSLAAFCGSLQCGICTGYVSPSESGIEEELGLNTAQISLFASILNFGGMIGAITSGYIADSIGRRGAMGVSSSFCLAGWLTIYLAKGALSLDIGRLATGYALGLSSYVVPIFITEIAPKTLRGALSSLTVVTMSSAIAGTFALGVVLDWRNLALVGIVPCAIQLSLIPVIPESPRWLAKIGKQKEFEASLQRLRGKHADISQEAADIQEYMETSGQLQKSKLTDLFQRKYLRSLIIGVGMIGLQQFGGMSGVSSYMSTVFDSIGFNANIGSIVFALFQVVLCSLMATRIDKAGRRVFLLISASGMVLGCTIVGGSSYLKDIEAISKLVHVVAFGGIMVYGGSYVVGVASIPNMIVAEIFPINVKGLAGSLTNLTSWICACIVVYTFNFLISWSSSGTFFIYAGINVLSFIFILILVPETKGKSLEEIQAAVNK
ncbi:unnamed protein product [Rhodiola kirilowii]